MVQQLSRFSQLAKIIIVSKARILSVDHLQHIPKAYTSNCITTEWERLDVECKCQVLQRIARVKKIWEMIWILLTEKFQRTRESSLMIRMALTWNHHKMTNLAKSKKIRLDLVIHAVLAQTKMSRFKVTSSITDRSISKQVTKLHSMNLLVGREKKVNPRKTS